jgi:hypothetical protein
MLYMTLVGSVGSVFEAFEGWGGLEGRAWGVIGGIGYGLVNLVMDLGGVIVQPVFNDNFKYWIIMFG